MTMPIRRKAYKFRLYPTSGQVTKLEHTLDLCRELYNAAVQERRDAYEWWKQHGQWIGVAKPIINLYSQYKVLTEIRAIREDVGNMPVAIARDPLKRVQRAFDGFFRRLEAGQKPGYPRFQGRNRYNSFTHINVGGWSLHNSKLTLARIGNVKVKMHREMRGKVKTYTITREGTGWYVAFSVEQNVEIPDHAGGAIGIDVGLEFFASMSDGCQVDNPRYFRRSQKHLAKVQRKLATIAKTAPDRSKYRQRVTNAYRRTRNQRMDFLHKLSHRLVMAYSLIVVERIQTANLSRRPKPKKDEAQSEAQGSDVYMPNGATAKSGLNKSIGDAGWRSFIQMLRYKAEWAGSKLIEVDPRFTSQTCPQCGAIAKKELSERWHACVCGASMPRDVAAALVILARGLASIGSQSVDAASAA